MTVAAAPPPAYTPEAWAEIQRLRASQWFLVRNDSHGERALCGRCGGKHERLTLMCVPVPFRGIGEGLKVYVRVSNSQRAVALGRTLADLERHHPWTARGLMPQDGSGTDVYALSVGTVEPISDKDAQALRLRIKMRVPARLYPR